MQYILIKLNLLEKHEVFILPIWTTKCVYLQEK